MLPEALAGAEFVAVDLGQVRARGAPLVPVDDPRFGGTDEAPAEEPEPWPLEGLDRTEQVRIIEERAAAALGALPAGATVLLRSLADPGTAPPMPGSALSAAGPPGD